MEIVFSHKIENVTSFQVDKSNIQLIFGKKLLLNDFIIEKNTDCLGVFIFDNLFSYSNYNDFKTRILNISTGVTEYTGVENIQPQMISREYVAYRYDKNFNSELYLFDSSFVSTFIKGFKNITVKFTYRSYAFFLIENSIHAYTLPTAQRLWQFSLEGLGSFTTLNAQTKSYRVLHFIGVYQNQLLVQLNNATLLMLNITTGKTISIVHLYKNLPLPKGGFYDDFCKMHLVNNHVVLLSNQSLTKINLDNFKAECIKGYYDAPREQQFRFMKNTYHNGHIYFVADYAWQYVTPSRVGVMDTTTGEVLWQQQLEKTGGLPEAPQVSGNKLYVLTANKELYIFEKQNT